MDENEKREYFAKVFYTEHKGRHKPQISLVVSNIDLASKPLSPKQLALVDSGADETILPYSLGVLIGLQDVSIEEGVNIVGGVGGGNINCVERKCSLFLENPLKKEAYEFNETVWWKVPSPEVKEKREQYIAELKSAAAEYADTKVGTSGLREKLQEKIDSIGEKIREINENLEGDIIMGRPFFDNFEFIQFNHSDRKKEEACFLTYQVKKEKIISTIRLDSSDLKEEIVTKRIPKK